MTADRSLRIGVVLEAFLDWPLDRVMPWLREHAPDVTDLEIGAGGYAPHPHCDVPGLLASDQARAAWRDEIAPHGLRIDALNAWGNPLHPDAELARERDRALRDAIRLGALLGVTRVVAPAEGQAMVAAADQAGVILMVGYPKRYDPAFTRMREETAELEGARLLRVTTSESPLRPYIGHYTLLMRVPLPAEVAADLRNDSRERIRAATSTATELERQVYEMVLLDTLVHELNTVRGLLGEPTRLDYASLALDHVTVMLRFGDLPAAIHWIDLPGIARYEMEFALYAPDRRLRLTFP